MKTIIHTVHIHAAPLEVFRSLTTQAGVTGWWTTVANVEPGEGGVIRFTFRGDFNPHMEQITLSKPDLVEWRCVAGHDHWKDNTFAFHIRPAADETSLRFIQQYAQELDDDTYGTYNFNWGYYLNSLKLLCEKGVGTPYEAVRDGSPPSDRERDH